MDMFPNPEVKNSFLQGNSAKPICGVVIKTSGERNLTEAKISAQAVACSPLKISFNGAATNAGTGLAPYTAEATPNAQAPNGFLIDSPTFVQETGHEAPQAQAKQIVYTALFGSGVEVYLPCDNTLSNWDGAAAIGWDDTNKCLKVGATPTIPVKIRSRVVNGIKTKNDSGVIKYADTPCVRVIL